MAPTNIKLVLEYDGSGFSGWQSQPGLRTIQTELERVLSTVLRVPVHPLYAAGRTDAGVHAHGQVVNFFLERAESEIDLMRLAHSVSSLMRGELAVLSAQIVPSEFNARSDARSKQYTYTLLAREAPAVLHYGRAWHVGARLNLALMREAAADLVGSHDFSSFRANGCTAKSPVREIISSDLIEQGDLLLYRVVGTGFLKQMVRNIVGTLVGIGRACPTLVSMPELLRRRDRRHAGMTAPAHGLCLDWVKY